MCDILEENDVDPSLREGLQFAITSSREKKKKISEFTIRTNCIRG
jgi:hypothetical protein